MTKAKLINELKMIEARAWKQVKDHEAYCIQTNGPDVDPKDWKEFQISMMNRYSVEWVVVKNTLEAVGIKPFDWTEVELLKQANKL